MDVLMLIIFVLSVFMILKKLVSKINNVDVQFWFILIMGIIIILCL